MSKWLEIATAPFIVIGGLLVVLVEVVAFVIFVGVWVWMLWTIFTGLLH